MAITTWSLAPIHTSYIYSKYLKITDYCECSCTFGWSGLQTSKMIFNIGILHWNLVFVRWRDKDEVYISRNANATVGIRWGSLYGGFSPAVVHDLCIKRRLQVVTF